MNMHTTQPMIVPQPATRAPGDSAYRRRPRNEVWARLPVVERPMPLGPSDRAAGALSGLLVGLPVGLAMWGGMVWGAVSLIHMI